jgi:Tat protein secretion system quality control protein TatD with DNase activity
MPVRRKRAKKPVKKATFEKQLQLVVQEAKRLDVHIRDLNKTFARGNYRML